MSKRLFWFIAIFVSIALVLTACFGSDEPAEEAAPAEEAVGRGR